MAFSSQLSRSLPRLQSIRQSPITMPLRARIQPAALSSRGYSSMLNKFNDNTASILADTKNDDPDDVIFSKHHALREIELNRPKKLNSLNESMAKKLTARLQELAKSDMASVTVLKGAGRAFCAGGDVVALADWNAAGTPEKSDSYFALEYKLDHLIATYPKPLVAYIDGITMGGGVGLSMHAPFRIATENTVFAMPETTIGFFPEVGATFFLPRMDGELGTYLALTSEQVRGVDVLYHGVATHYVHSSALASLSQRLGELQFRDTSDLNERYRLIDQTIAEFNSTLPATRPAISGAIRQAIDSCFKHNEALDILADLEAIKGSNADEAVKTWATKTISTIRERSPIGVEVTLRSLRLGRQWNIAQSFQNEHEIARVFMRHGDFTTGVKARLVERLKTRPNWQPNTLEDVTKEDVDAFFAGCDRKERLNLYRTGPQASYKDYPHKWLSLPTDEEIEGLLTNGVLSVSTVIDHFMKERDGKQGIKEKVEEVVERLELSGRTVLYDG